jgi:hypothetical protein
MVDDDLDALRKEFTEGLYAGYRFLAQHPIKYKHCGSWIWSRSSEATRPLGGW